MTKRLIVILIFAVLATYPASEVDAQRSGYEGPPINYFDAEVDDPVAKLSRQLDSGQTRLEFDETFGYLKAVLKALDIPVSSQTLVFSKTSMQLDRISPRRPRSLYFNDNVYVGFCQRGGVLEFAATDAKQGATFYTLDQSEQDQPRLIRDRGNCLSCHATSKTQNVPGYLVRSVFADAMGRPKLGSGTFVTDQTSEFKDRWGGWYVTGDHGSMRHMGNQICKTDEYDFDRDIGANIKDLSDKFRTSTYLTPHSDIVALMVLEHQTQMHNAIAAANYETRQAMHQSFEMNKLLERPEGFLSDSANRRIDAVTDQLLRHLLMCDEFPLQDPVSGTSGFAAEFESRGKQDSQGRSLRQFDLKTRMFRYPCSYLIHCDAFGALPEEVRGRTIKRLIAILTDEDESGDFQHIDPASRRAILEILHETHPDFDQAI